MKKFLSSRIGLAILFLLVSAGCTIVFAALFSLFTGNFISACQTVFWFLFAPGIVSAALLLLTKINDEWVFGYGIGLYYGTAILATLTPKLGWDIPFQDRVTLGAVVSSLIGYAFYKHLPNDK